MCPLCASSHHEWTQLVVSAAMFSFFLHPETRWCSISASARCQASVSGQNVQLIKALQTYFHLLVFCPRSCRVSTCNVWLHHRRTRKGGGGVLRAKCHIGAAVRSVSSCSSSLDHHRFTRDHLRSRIRAQKKWQLGNVRAECLRSEWGRFCHRTRHKTLERLREQRQGSFKHYFYLCQGSHCARCSLCLCTFH